MNLSKAQQEVVDKMREGAILRFNHSCANFDLLDEDGASTVRRATGDALKRAGAIEVFATNDTNYYRLTEQHKTKPE